MKRLSLVGILCSILALMRLVSCNDSSLPQDILGEWVADPKILKNLEWMGGGQTKVYSLDWTFGGGSRGWIKAGKTLTLREEGDEAYLNVSIVTPIIYNVHDGGLSFRLDKDSIQVEILECLINGENYKDVVAQSVKGEGKATLQSACDTVTEQLKELVKEDIRRQIDTPMDGIPVDTPMEVIYSYDARVKDDILRLKRGGNTALTFHRKKSPGATAP